MKSAARIDLNADLGEGGSFDPELLQIVSSCNIACGGHAGNAASMRTTLENAIANGVAIGAHPSYPDREGFGRRRNRLSDAKLRDSLLRQIEALQSIAQSLQQRIRHVKPHGALYSDAARDQSLAALVTQVVKTTCADATITGPPLSALQTAAQAAGLAYRVEGFVDRAYRPDGRLVPRSEPNAVHADINTITTQAMTLAVRGEVTTETGEIIKVPADTLCIHGDTPNAGEIARAVRDVLQSNGIVIRAAH